MDSLRMYEKDSDENFGKNIAIMTGQYKEGKGSKLEAKNLPSQPPLKAYNKSIKN